MSLHSMCAHVTPRLEMEVLVELGKGYVITPHCTVSYANFLMNFINYSSTHNTMKILLRSLTYWRRVQIRMRYRWGGRCSTTVCRQWIVHVLILQFLVTCFGIFFHFAFDLCADKWESYQLYDSEREITVKDALFMEKPFTPYTHVPRNFTSEFITRRNVGNLKQSGRRGERE